jgi:hypothetical protein
VHLSLCVLPALRHLVVARVGALGRRKLAVEVPDMWGAEGMLIYLIAAAAGVIVAILLCRPAPQQYVVMPIEPAPSSGNGCLPLLLVAITVVIIIALTSS